MDDSPVPGFSRRPGWLLLLAALLVAQGWLTLRLFSTDLNPDPLLNDKPLLSGRHPLHEYHGHLGAQAWWRNGTSTTYDPAFQAGYPKTPLFDGGSRPAELIGLIGGSGFTAYKIGVARMGCLFVPLAFVVMARGINLPPGVSCLAGLLGAMLWWSDPIRAVITHGDLDLLLGGLCVLMHVCWFVRFDRTPGVISWLGMTLTAAIAWYIQPWLMLGYLPFLLLYYLWVAVRQGILWHVTLTASVAFAIGINAGWLIDWGRYLWVYCPFGGDNPQAPANFLSMCLDHWRVILPTCPVHMVVSACGLLGLLVMLATNRGAAWILALGVLGYTVAGAAGILWPPLAEFGTEKLLLMAVWCLVCPCAHVLGGIAAHFSKATGVRSVGILWLAAALSGLAWSIDLPRYWLHRPNLEVGLNTEREEVVRVLRDHTRDDSRILWEDRPGNANGYWSSLLPCLTERPFLGGLDPDGHLEHMKARLSNGNLTGKPIREWTDADLRGFFDRYNVGWIVAWNPASIERFNIYPGAKALQHVRDGQDGVLYVLDRRPTYFLKGTGRLIEASPQRVALADVVPVNGEVVLSMHYQSNWRISPGYVQIEPDLDPNDPVPFLRLRMAGPIARLTLVWED